ncbi:RNA 2',3'-cyclic phosphodiesterase [Achromobacter xylosoxidans]|uniref:RNA 2',3'-cyclic phosphodiesterase n=1 Tax=Alcaligenes xylosoxydans xylosoxydans TaxID=85698 RepID=UPI0006BFF952|nr:RNA 2',3'-cyclic phosphodiesterase [Achromobacter xylosoxidans]CUJ71616.1 2'-5'-RNA ligase [Achromobacter xylosoxidans]CUK10545.1 2'-5'-RNA ligase [Achromobacter xylosoxidans]
MSPIRLFYALWPDTPLANTLSTWATQAQPHSRGRAMRTETLHMTLAFLGSVEKEIADELIDATPYHRLQPGTVTLDRYGVFARPRILWAGPAQTPASLQASHDGLWLWLSAFGFVPPAQPFRPHVTLLRNIERNDPPADAPPPLTWHYDRMVLVASESTDGGSRYRVVARSKPQPG